MSEGDLIEIKELILVFTPPEMVRGKPELDEEIALFKAAIVEAGGSYESTRPYVFPGSSRAIGFAFDGVVVPLVTAAISAIGAAGAVWIKAKKNGRRVRIRIRDGDVTLEAATPEEIPALLDHVMIAHERLVAHKKKKK